MSVTHPKQCGRVKVTWSSVQIRMVVRRNRPVRRFRKADGDFVCVCLFVFFVQGKNYFMHVRFSKVLPMLPSLMVMTAQVRATWGKKQ